jgi:hypothetical protein
VSVHDADSANRSSTEVPDPVCGATVAVAPSLVVTDVDVTGSSLTPHAARSAPTLTAPNVPNAFRLVRCSIDLILLFDFRE